MLTFYKIYYSLLILLLLNACTPPITSQWTVLVYLDGDNDLAQANIDDMAEMQLGATASHIRILVQLDLPNGQPAKRFEIKESVTSELENIGEVNMAEEQTLTDFLLWTKTQNLKSTDNILLILSDHGNGWDQGLEPAPSKPSARSLFVDQDNNTGIIPALPNYRVRNAIRNSNITLDILGLDASIMGTIEAIYEFSDLAPIIISSQEIGDPNGWNYADIFQKLSANTYTSPKEFSEIIVKSYENYFEKEKYPSASNLIDQGFSIAAHDTQKIQTIKNDIDLFATLMTNKLNDDNYSSKTLSLIQAALKTTQKIDLFGQINVYLDLSHLIENLDSNSDIPAALKEATISEYHGKDRPNANGLSIVFFQPPNAWDFNTCDANYRDWNEKTQTGNKGKFINETQWDEFLATFYEKIIPSLDNYNVKHRCNTLFQ